MCFNMTTLHLIERPLNYLVIIFADGRHPASHDKRQHG